MITVERANEVYASKLTGAVKTAYELYRLSADIADKRWQTYLSRTIPGDNSDLEAYNRANKLRTRYFREWMKAVRNT